MSRKPSILSRKNLLPILLVRKVLQASSHSRSEEKVIQSSPSNQSKINLLTGISKRTVNRET